MGSGVKQGLEHLILPLPKGYRWQGGVHSRYREDLRRDKINMFKVQLKGRKSSSFLKSAINPDVVARVRNAKVWTGGWEVGWGGAEARRSWLQGSSGPQLETLSENTSK